MSHRSTVIALVSVGTPLLWAIFLGIVFLLLALDLGVFHRKAHEIRAREALLWSAFWIGISLVFNGWVFLKFGPALGTQFLTAYLLEKALSVDNLFVFLLLFSHFAVPAQVQHRVLYWGIVGALVTRAAFIIGGIALIQMFHWILYVFGAFLVFTGIKILAMKEKDDEDVQENRVVRFFRKIVRMTPNYEGTSFFVRREGVLFATPLLLVLVAIESTDVAFATDSIPAVFGISQDPFIVFTSNIFAVLGLRALYFALAAAMKRLQYLNIGLGLVLAFIGVKMLAEHWLDPWVRSRFPSRSDLVQAIGSLAVIATILTVTIVLSLLKRPKPAAETAEKSRQDAEVPR